MKKQLRIWGVEKYMERREGHFVISVKIVFF